MSDLEQWLTGKLNELAPGYPPITVVVQDEAQQIFAAGAGVPACQAVLLSTRRPCGGTDGVRLADSGCQNEHMQRLRLCARCRADGINWCKSCFEVTGGDLVPVTFCLVEEPREVPLSVARRRPAQDEDWFRG